jgi:hypothetical protein
MIGRIRGDGVKGVRAVGLVVAVAVVAVVVLARWGTAEVGAQGSFKSYVPVAARGASLNPPLRFGARLTGQTVTLSRSGAEAGARQAAQVEATITDMQGLDLSFDNGQVDFLATFPSGALDQIPAGGTFALDLYGRFTDVSSGPAASFNPRCASIETFRELRVDGFRPNETLQIRGNQIGGDEAIDFTGRYYTDQLGAGSFQVAFGSGVPKSWGLVVTGRESGLVANTLFDSIAPDGACPTQTPVPTPVSLWSTGPAYGTNSTFHMNVVRENSVWGGRVRTWDAAGARWGDYATLPNVTISGNTIGGSATAGQLGRSSGVYTSESGLAFGALSSYFGPGATTGVGKPAMLDRQRGPAGLMTLDQSQPPQPPASGIQVWLGCSASGGSSGFAAPPCPPQARGAAQTSVPVFVGALAPSTPPGTVLSTIYITRGGKTSLLPYGTYDPNGVTFVFNTNPPSATPGITSDNIPICGSAIAWAEVNRLRGCADMQNYPPNYVANLQGRSDPARYTQYATGVPGQVAAWIPNFALGEQFQGLYALLPPNHHAYMPYVFRGTWGVGQVTVEWAQAPVGVPD